ATISVTANAKSLLAVQSALVSSLWFQPADNPAGAREITMPGSRYEGSRGIGWTPDGKILYTTRCANSVEVWMRDAVAGEGRRLLSENASIENPRASADGRHLTFSSNRSAGIWHLWRYDLQDGSLRQLTDGHGEMYGTLSPDGSTVAYVELDK